MVPRAVLLLLAVSASLLHCRVESKFDINAKVDDLHPIEEEEEACRSVAQLNDTLQVAAYNTTSFGKNFSAVIITTCDLNCLKHLFHPFIYGMEKSRDGDFSPHLIIVTNGAAAYMYCDALRTRHKHRCVLDRFCFTLPKDLGMKDGKVAHGSGAYFYALLLKIVWAQEVVNAGYSVLWTDMDINFFANPFKLLLQYPDADFLIQPEYWDDNTIFPGPAVKWPHGSLHQNGGLWLAHPTPGGRGLMDVWVSLLHEELIVKGGVYTASLLDQSALQGIIGRGTRSTPKYSWRPVDPKNHTSFVRLGDATRPAKESIYRLSMQWFQSRCWGLCGYYGPNKPFAWRMKSDATGPRVECDMPKASWDRMITFHHNCNGDYASKREGMIGLQRVLVNEANWVNSNLSITPADEAGAWYTKPEFKRDAAEVAKELVAVAAGGG